MTHFLRRASASAIVIVPSWLAVTSRWVVNRHMDAQQEHDLAMSKATFKNLKGSRPRLEALLAKKKSDSSQKSQSDTHDVIGAVVKRHPGLTREKAEEMAREFGF